MLLAIGGIHVRNYSVTQGVPWQDHPRTYTCQEACATLFGGTNASWEGSTNLFRNTGTCFYSRYDEHGQTSCYAKSHNFHNCKQYNANCWSALVYDACDDSAYLNYCWPSFSSGLVSTFDMNRNSWLVARGRLQKPRAFCVAAHVHGKIVVAGGEVRHGNHSRASSSAEYFDGINWRPLPDMNVARSQAASVVLHGDLYVLGGLSNWSCVEGCV